MEIFMIAATHNSLICNNVSFDKIFKIASWIIEFLFTLILFFDGGNIAYSLHVNKINWDVNFMLCCDCVCAQCNKKKYLAQVN